jgi:C1A family cysteine protease
VHLSFNTAASFRNPDANGYVQYNPADPVPTGAHAILAVGFVANADLPAGVPNDPDGRGYFIIKNSWGTGYGDCGFSYLSTEFVRQWAYGFRYLEKTVTFR